MIYFLDTEFAESPGQLDLISIALVAGDGREYYAIAEDGWHANRCSPWVHEHVLPTLGPLKCDRCGAFHPLIHGAKPLIEKRVNDACLKGLFSMSPDAGCGGTLRLANDLQIPRAQIKAEIRDFVGDEKPEFWGYYADYDWVAFCWLFGAMIDLPKGWPMFCRDVRQLADQIDNPTLPHKSDMHNALEDARCLAANYRWLIQQGASPGQLKRD